MLRISLSPTLMQQLANRLSPQAGKSLVISRKRARGRTCNGVSRDIAQRAITRKGIKP